LITLLAADGTIIESFRYDDKAPWPENPDGSGPSLTRILPPFPPSDPASWRPSVKPGGSPSTDDSQKFTGDPNADLDRDGLSALLEYAHGTSDTMPDFQGNLFTINLEGTVILTLQRNLAADDIAWSFEHSPDLETWLPSDDELLFLGTKDLGDGSARLKFSNNEDFAARHFWRARTTTR